MGNCSSETIKQELLKEVIEEFRGRGATYEVNNLIDILKGKNMLPDSWIFEECISENKLPITSQPQSNKPIEEPTHSAKDRLLLSDNEHASSSHERIKYLENEVIRLQKQRDGFERHLNEQRHLTEGWKREEGTSQRRHSESSVRHAAENKLSKGFDRSKKIHENSGDQQQPTGQVSVNEEKEQQQKQRDQAKHTGSGPEVKTQQYHENMTREYVTVHPNNEKLTNELVELKQAQQPDYKAQTVKLENLQRENEEIRRQLRNTQKEKQSEYEKLTEKLRNLQQEKQNDLEKLRGEIAELQQEKEHDLQKLRAEIAELQQEKQDHVKLTRGLTDSQEENLIQQKTDRQIRDLESNLEKARSKIQELEITEKKRKCELGEKEKELNSYCNENGKLLTDLGEARSQYQDMQNDLNSQIDQLQGENKSMASSIGELEKDREELVQQLDKKDKALQDAETRVDNLLEKTTYLEREKQSLNESLTDQIGKLIQEKNQMAVSITDLRKYRENLEKQFDNSEDKLKIVQSNKAKLTEELEILQQEFQTTRTDLEKHIVSLKGDKSELSSTIEKLHQNVAVKEREIGDTEDQLKTMKLNKDKLEQELDILRQEYQTHRSEREKQIVLLRGDKSTLSSRVEILQQNIAKMEIQLGDNEDKLKAVQSDKDKLTEEMEALQQEYQTTRTDLRAQIVSLREDNSSLSSTVEKLQQNVLGLKTQCDSLQATLDAVNMAKETLEKEMGSLQEEKQQQHKDMSTKLEDLRAECSTLSATTGVLQQEKDGLEKKLGSLQATLHTVSMEKEVSEKEVASLQERLTDISTKMKDLTAANSTLISNNDDLKQEKELLQEQFDAKDEELQKLHREMKEAAERAKRKSVVLSLRSEGSGMGKAMVDMVTRELTRGLEGKVDKTRMDLTIQPYKPLAGALCGPLLVFCLNMSRIGTNIIDALKGIIVTKDVIVLVLHHTSKENLPSLTPTSLRVTGSELRQLGGIIDMAFTSDSGVYECELNKKAIEKLVVILQKYK